MVPLLPGGNGEKETGGSGSGGSAVRLGDVAPPSPLKVALACAKFGWRVVPAHQTEKRPGLKGWPELATVDVDQIGQWWATDFAGRPVCLATGRASNVWVLDVDVKDDGAGTLAALEAEWGALPETFTVETPSGGRHYYFAWPEAGVVRNSVRKLGPGLDTRGDGGQVMAPGTTVKGRQYRVVNPVLPLVQAPGWLLSLVEKTADGVVPAGSGEGSGGPALDEEVQRYLEEGLPAGAHDDTLARVAARLAARGYPEGVTLVTLRAMIEKTDVDPERGGWSDEDLLGKIRSALEKFKPEPLDPVLAEWAAGVLPAEVVAPVPPSPEVVAAAVGTGGHLTSTRGEPPASEKNADRFGNPGVPVESAGVVIKRLFSWRDDAGERRRGLKHWRGEWRVYTGTHWGEVSEDAMRAVMYRFFADATFQVPVEYPDDEDKAQRKRERRAAGGLDPDFDDRDWNPNRARVADVLGALAGLTEEPEETELPSWTDGGSGETGEVTVPCANGLLRVRPGGAELVRHDTAYFCGHALPFAYDPAAGCGRWLQFLEEVFPGDAESRALLQEWFGYVVSGRLDLQKMMIFVGASRSGKSTIAKVLTGLLGAVNVASPMLGSFASNFGLSALIGKPLAVVDDARYSSKMDIQAITEKLLSIVGASPVNVDRKNKTIWSGVLLARLMLLSNELPNFKDSSEAIVNRMLVLYFRESFLGREDTHLVEKLLAELPGILNWALEGLRRLELAGKFTTASEAGELVAELRDSVNPMGTFIAECCVVGAKEECVVSDLTTEYLMWLGKPVDVPVSRSTETAVGKALRAALPRVRKVRRTVENRGRLMVYEGVAVVPAAVRWAQEVAGEAGKEV